MLQYSELVLTGRFNIHLENRAGNICVDAYGHFGFDPYGRTVESDIVGYANIYYSWDGMKIKEVIDLSDIDVNHEKNMCVSQRLGIDCFVTECLIAAYADMLDGNNAG